MLNRVEELKKELSRLMEEHLESLRRQAFVSPHDEQLEADEKRLKRIREVSGDYLAAMEESMTDKPNVKLPGKVEKVIKPAAAHEPEKAQIAIEGADPLYREIRIENTFKDAVGQEVHLKENDDVDVTVETDPSSAEPQEQGEPKTKKKLEERKAS